MSHTSGSTTPVPSKRILPSLNGDILYQIFQYVISIDRLGPWLLCDVCLGWKSLVLNSPVLWTRVYVDDFRLDWEERFASALILSKQLPLHMTLRLPLSQFDLVRDSIPRWETLTVIVTEGVSVTASYRTIKELLGDRCPPRLSEIQWLDEYDDVIEPPSSLISKPNMFGKCLISAARSIQPFKGLDQYPLIVLDLTQSAEESAKMPVVVILDGLATLPFLRTLSFDTSIIDWDGEQDRQPRPIQLSALEHLTLIHTGKTWDQEHPSQLGMVLKLMKLPTLVSLELKGVPGDIASTCGWIEPAKRLRNLSLHVSYMPYPSQSENHKSISVYKSAVSLSSLSFHLYAPPISYQHFQPRHMDLRRFAADIIQISKNIKDLSVAFQDFSMAGFFWAFTTHFQQLHKLSWTEGVVSSSLVSSISNDLLIKSDCLPKLEVLELISCWDILELISLRCPSLRKVSFTDQSKPRVFLNRVPTMNYLQVLQLDNSVIGFAFPEEHPVLVNLRLLTCTAKVAEHFLLSERTPQLTKLTLLYDNSTDHDMTFFVDSLASSQSIQEIEFAGTIWAVNEDWVRDIDAYLTGLRNTLIKSHVSNERPIMPIQTIASRTYPDWDCLMDVMSLLNSLSFWSRMRSLKLPAFPNPSILKLIVSHLRGEIHILDEQKLPLKWEIEISGGSGCQFCRKSGWVCPYVKVIQCTRHLEKGFVEITEYSM